MKSFLVASTTLILATPSLAHADGSFHTHGAEVLISMAAIAVLAVAVLKSNP
jgi:hypothetical protein